MTDREFFMGAGAILSALFAAWKWRGEMLEKRRVDMRDRELKAAELALKTMEAATKERDGERATSTQMRKIDSDESGVFRNTLSASLQQAFAEMAALRKELNASVARELDYNRTLGTCQADVAAAQREHENCRMQLRELRERVTKVETLAPPAEERRTSSSQQMAAVVVEKSP